MKISFVSDSESGVNIFPILIARLTEEIADLKIEESFVPYRLDIPHKVLELSENSDLIFVFSIYSEKTFEVQILLEKLIDVELQTGKKVIKAVEQSDLEEIADDAEKETEKEALAEKWASFIVNYLYHPEKFTPESEGTAEGEDTDFGPFT